MDDPHLLHDFRATCISRHCGSLVDFQSAVGILKLTSLSYHDHGMDIDRNLTAPAKTVSPVRYLSNIEIVRVQGLITSCMKEGSQEENPQAPL